jgi:TgpA N-terminal domain/Transglutaminase-like superfamily
VTMRRLLAAVLLPVAAAMTVVASTPWLRAFPPATVWPLFILAAVISVAIPPLVVTLTRRSVAWSAGASLVILIVFSLLVVLHDPTGVGSLWRGFSQGVARLLSIALPVSAPRWLLVPPVVLCWLVGAASSELLTRSRSTGLAPLIGVVGFCLAYAATAGAPGTMVLEAALLGLAAGSLLFLRRWMLDTENLESGEAGRPSHDPTRPLVLGLVTLVVVAVVCALAIPQAPTLKGAAKAPHRAPPVMTVAPLTPTVGLAELRGESSAGGQARTLFVVRMNKPSSGYLAAVDLDNYNGDVWSLHHTFEPTGGRVRLAPGPGQTNRAQADVVQHYRVVDAPDLPWMPYLNQPVSVSGVGVDFDSLSGMVIPTQPLADGQTYSVTSAATSRTLASLTSGQLAHLSAASTRDQADAQPLAGAATSFDNVLTQLETETGQSSGASLSFLRAVADDFRTNYRRVATAEYAPATAKPRTESGGGTTTRPDLYGTSLADIQGAIFGKSKTGTPEQFATLMTLLARKLGVPARLVTGYRLSGPSAPATPTRPDTEYRVTNLDAWAWVEIYVPPLGWLVVDPTPSKTGLVPAQAPSAGPTTTTLPPTQIHATVTPGHSGHAVAPRVHLASAGHSNPLVLVLAVVLVLALLIGLVPATIWAVKARRRRRRRYAADPDRQIEGAWLETLDVLAEAEVTGLAPLTNSEVASQVEARYGPDAGSPVAVLARAASAVTFAPSREPDPETSEQAWAEFDDFQRALSARQSGRERLRSRLRVARRRRP